MRADSAGERSDLIQGKQYFHRQWEVHKNGVFFMTPLLNFEIQFGNTSNFLSNHNKYTCYQLDNNKYHIKPI